MKTAIVFVNKRQASIVSSKEELIKEINHYKAYWLSFNQEYNNISTNVKIIVHDLTEADSIWLSARMR